MNYVYNVVYDDNKVVSVMVFHGSSTHLLNAGHHNIEKVVEALEGGADIGTLMNLISDESGVMQKFAETGGDVQVINGELIYKGEILNGALADAIVKAHREGLDDFSRLVKFLERVTQNPSQNSRINLYRWLDNGSFSITEDGLILGYKGVRMDMNSVFAGYAYVDGRRVEGHIPNQPGNTISMDRKDVTFDPNEPCSYGLHVGTWDYARHFGQVTVSVLVDPADVVSVPSDHNGSKMRTCKYTVKDVVDRQHSSIYFDASDPDYEDW